ncbi:LlaJI family restriction endonuclease [Vibrio vulnificus]|uniref:LlaJI family restriction endonuclease n=1 Tax=Vibrio vulnificus TaxID=672 RepID=UPI0028789531|nr:LlaJI family restriction endonuclease [Vibrio vulnificus]MDS1825417.1 LlaJI family restriction endonuclease [Vibrio vulnificus]
MRRKVNCRTDRDLVTYLPSELRALITEQNLVTSNGKKVSFCGVIICGVEIHTFLPQNSDKPVSNEKECYRVSSQLMKSVHRYSTDKTSKEFSLDEGKECIGDDRLSLISELLGDYCANGLYSRRVSQKVLNTGKTDWKRTITNQLPYQGNKGPVYLDFNGTKRRYASDCEVARIHARIIRELDSSFGWIITGSDVSVAKNIMSVPAPKGTDIAMINTLKKELRLIYSDREKRLLKLLIKHLESEHGRDSSNFIVGLKNYHVLWEHMLDKSLTWGFKVNKLISSPAYKINGKIVSAKNKGQRMDTVLHQPHTNKYAVIDAKYYEAQSPQGAPGWPDLVKQFFYAKALSVYDPFAQINNAFIFPGSGPIESAHMRDPITKKLQDADYPPILCVYVEPILLIDHYVKGKKLENLSRRLLTF